MTPAEEIRCLIGNTPLTAEGIKDYHAMAKKFVDQQTVTMAELKQFVESRGVPHSLFTTLNCGVPMMRGLGFEPKYPNAPQIFTTDFIRRKD